MTHLWWVVALAGTVQDSEWSLSARGQKTSQGFELVVRGSSPALRTVEAAELWIRRLIHRFDEEAGALGIEPVGETRPEAVLARDGAFVHRQAFEAPMEVEVEATARTSEGCLVERASIRAWTAPVYAAVAALEADAQRADAAIGGVEGLLDELEALQEISLRRIEGARKLRAKVERRRAEWAPELSRSLLAATARWVDALLEDLHRAAESASAGRPAGGFLARASGRPFTVEEARRRIGRAKAIRSGERMLVLVRATASLQEEIRAGAATGCPFRWSRVEQDVERSLEAVAQADQEGHLEQLVGALRDFLAEAVGRSCPESRQPGVLERRLTNQVEELERRYRLVGS